MVTTDATQLTLGFQEESVPGVLSDPTVSSPKFKLYGEDDPSIQMTPKALLPETGAE